MYFAEIFPPALVSRVGGYVQELLGGTLRLPFVVSTLAVMAAIYLASRRKRGLPTSLRDAAAFLFPRKVYLDDSAKNGYKFFLIDPLVRRLLFAPAMAIPVSAWVFSAVQELLPRMLGGPPFELRLHESFPVVFAVAFTAASALLRDLGYYMQHVLMHKIPFLWEFHKVHHSATVLTPLTDWRVHPLDMLSIPYFGALLLGTMQACVDYFFASNLAAVEVMGVNAFNFFYLSIAYHLRHTHIWFSFGPRLSHVLMSPAQHQIHHSKAQRHWDKNFGSAFSVWDWLFGTLYVPREKEKLVFGLPNGEDKEYSSLWKLYSLPFTKNVQAGRALLVAALAAVLGFFVVTAVLAPGLRKLFG